tara:strand:+ start:4754 stop:5725 length:972 start_codon:yes stop_codon:yes gene_type:complete
MSLLSVKDLVTAFYLKDGGLNKAVNGVSFDINKGETLGLVGESGCGKSVTALSIMKLIPNRSGKILEGKILFNDFDLLSLNESEIQEIRGRDIGMIFQEPMSSLNPILDIGEQISESLIKHLKISKRSSIERVIELLDMVGIPDGKNRINDYPHQFSGGQRQRLMIAIALACEPSLLIADEPTTSLDVTIQAQILELMKNLSDNLGVSLLLITHNLGIVARYANKIAVMYGGKIREMGPSLDVFNSPIHPYTLGLLNSVPRISGPRINELSIIPGEVTDFSNLPSGCAFSERCINVIKKCDQEPPISIYNSTEYACWNPNNLD